MRGLRLVAFWCERCQRAVVEAPATATVWCRCGRRATRAKDEGRLNDASEQA